MMDKQWNKYLDIIWINYGDMYTFHHYFEEILIIVGDKG